MNRRLNNYKKGIMTKREEMKKEQEVQVQKQWNFKPAILKKSKKLVKEKHDKQMSEMQSILYPEFPYQVPLGDRDRGVPKNPSP